MLILISRFDLGLPSRLHGLGSDHLLSSSQPLKSAATGMNASFLEMRCVSSGLRVLVTDRELLVKDADSIFAPLWKILIEYLCTLSVATAWSNAVIAFYSQIAESNPAGK